LGCSEFKVVVVLVEKGIDNKNVPLGKNVSILDPKMK
jgi:hypothetical protein